jgi:hypothetical protein
MWSHLERQAGGGQVKGMGEKQIEIDKRLLRKRMQSLSKDIDEISGNRSGAIPPLLPTCIGLSTAATGTPIKHFGTWCSV